MRLIVNHAIGEDYEQALIIPLIHVCRIHCRQASRRPARPGVQRAVVPQPVQIRVLPQERHALTVGAPRQAATEAGGAAAAVRAGHGSIQSRGCAANVPAQTWRERHHARRLQVPRAGAVQGPREPDAGRGVGVPLRRAHRPRASPRQGNLAERPLLRALPGDVVAAAAALPDQEPPEPDRRGARELREPRAERHPGGGVRARLRVRGPTTTSSSTATTTGGSSAACRGWR
jgi:hypothetical protein